MSTRVGSINVNINYNNDVSSYKRILNEIKAIGNIGKKVSKDVSNSFSSINSSVRGVGNSVNSISNKILSVGKVIKGVVLYKGVRALNSMSSSAITLASSLIEVQNVVDVTFGSMSKDINEFSKNALNSFGLSELSAKKYASTLGAILKSQGIADKDISNMSIELTKLIGDAASFYDLDSGDVFDKFKSGITGQVKAMQSLGITMTVANLEQYALTQGIEKSWLEMTQAEKVSLRYAYMLYSLRDAQGDFVRTSGTWANQTRLLAENWNSLKAVMGSAFMTALLPVVKMLNAVILKVTQLTKGIVGLINSLLGKNKEVESNTSKLSNNLDSASDSLNDMSSGYDDVAKSAKKAKNGVASFDDIIQLNSGSEIESQSAQLEDISYPDEDIVLPKTEDIEPIDWESILNESGLDASKVKETFITIGNEAKSIFNGVKEFLSDFFAPFSVSWGEKGASVFDSIKSAYQSTKEFASKFGEALVALSANGGADIVLNIIGILAIAWDQLMKIGSRLADFFNPENNASVQWLLDKVKELTGWLAGDGQGAVRLFVDIWAAWKIGSLLVDLGKLIFSIGAATVALWGNVTATLASWVAKVKDAAATAYLIGLFAADAIKKGISTAATWAMVAAQTAWNAVTTIATAVGSAFGAVMAFLTSPIGLVIIAVTALIAGIILLIKNWDTVKETMQRFGDWLKGVFEKDWSESFGFIGDIMNGFFDNIGSIIDGIKLVFSGFIKFVKGVFKGDWKMAFEGLVDIIKGLFKSIGGIMLLPINNVIDIINSVLKGVNKLKVPDWVPGIGGNSINIPLIPKPTVALADGGVVNRATNALIGEAGPEVVFPLKNSDFIEAFASMIATKIGGNGNQGVAELHLHVENLYGDDAYLRDFVKKLIVIIKSENIRVGGVS